ncbi:MAG: hypothetical protein DVB22_002596 [Verrucomicrobia bacterium]|nr:MAG: hypothetical protein DVB22_002596 [Verrucomicrobiota bacterium]
MNIRPVNPKYQPLIDIIVSPRRLPEGMKLVRMSRKDAEWAGMAPAVAGGWVATRQPCEANPMHPSGHIALVPESWSTGQNVRLEEVQEWWANGYEWEDAVAKIGAFPPA